MTEEQKWRLATFHQTISEQLNARLSESPKFFAVLVVVSTGYGYVLLTVDVKRELGLFALTSLLACGAVLKGAMLLRLWSDQPYRATRDLDLLRKGDGSYDAIRMDVVTPEETRVTAVTGKIDVRERAA